MYKQQASFMREKFTSFFSYYPKEAKSMGEVANTLVATRKNFVTKLSRLYATKAKLFAEHATQKWEISADTLKKHPMKEIESNKSLAMTLILPKVSVCVS